MSVKVCNRCHERPAVKGNRCAECIREATNASHRAWYARLSAEQRKAYMEKIKNYNKLRYATDSEFREHYKLQRRVYYKKHRDKLREYRRTSGRDSNYYYHKKHPYATISKHALAEQNTLMRECLNKLMDVGSWDSVLGDVDAWRNGLICETIREVEEIERKRRKQ